MTMNGHKTLQRVLKTIPIGLQQLRDYGYPHINELCYHTTLLIYYIIQTDKLVSFTEFTHKLSLKRCTKFCQKIN